MEITQAIVGINQRGGFLRSGFTAGVWILEGGVNAFIITKVLRALVPSTGVSR